MEVIVGISMCYVVLYNNFGFCDKYGEDCLLI